jgi:hypothetical protein
LGVLNTVKRSAVDFPASRIGDVCRDLLSIFEPIKSNDDKYTITMEALVFAKAYISDPDEVAKLAAECGNPEL